MYINRKNPGSFLSKEKEFVFLYIIFFIGLVFILREYVGGRSLWVDEAMLALNINRSFKELLVPLDNHQTAPLLFLFLSKFFTMIFGFTDYALRITPLISGFGSLYLFLLISKRILDLKAKIFAMTLFIFTEKLIYYTNEFKPYATDVFFAVLFLYFLVILYEQKLLSLKFLLIVGFSGLFSIWFSFSAIIIIAAFIPFFLYKIIKYNDRKKIIISSLFSGAWILNIFLEYILIYKKNPDYNYIPLLNYWTNNFMPFPPKNMEEFLWLPKSFRNFFIYMTNSDFFLVREYPVIKYIFAYIFIGAFIYGIFYIFKYRKQYNYLVFFLLCLFGLAFIASALNKYPFGDRLTLFIVPLTLLICSVGFSQFAGLFFKIKKVNKILLVCFLIFLLALPGICRVYHLIEPTYKSEIKSVVNYYKQNRQVSDKVFVKNHKVYYLPEWQFYSDLPFDFTDLKEDYITVKTEEELMIELYGNSRVWAIGDMGPAKESFKLIETYKIETLASRWPFLFLKRKIEYLNHPNAVIYLYDCSKTNLERLLLRFYQFSFDKIPENKEIEELKSILTSGSQSIEDIAFYFFNNGIMINKDLSDEKFIEIIYKILLDRNPQPSEIQHWVTELKKVNDRSRVVQEILISEEFITLKSIKYRLN